MVLTDGRPLTTAELVDMGDLDALLIRIDHLCADRDWAGVLDLRDRCRRALERGRQLWPAASHAEYRLALEAPGREAAAMLVPGTGRFALGPLAEVAASTHTWAELRPAPAALRPRRAWPPTSGWCGARTSPPTTGIDPDVLELPLRLQPWEPDYPLRHLPGPQARVPGAAAAVDLVGRGPPRLRRPPVADPEPCRALAELALAWKQESNGTVAVVAVDGVRDGRGRGPGRAGARVASGRGHPRPGDGGDGRGGRQRWGPRPPPGLAAGRFAAWWALAALAGQLESGHSTPTTLGTAAAGLRWYRWEAGPLRTGWSLRLAVEDPARGRAWAVDAADRV